MSKEKRQGALQDGVGEAFGSTVAGRFPIGDGPLALEPKEKDSWVPYTWSYEAHSALSKLEGGLGFRGFEPRNTLGRVPPLPDRVQCGLLKPSLLSTKWRVTGSKDCDVVGQMPPVPLRLQTSSPTAVALSGNSNAPNGPPTNCQLIVLDQSKLIVHGPVQ